MEKRNIPAPMRAVLFDGNLKFVVDHPVPELKPGWALIKVKYAGICQTDMEILMGYAGFNGILGHEFIGSVEDCDNPDWIGRRVSGEINLACGHCEWCKKGLGRHCPNRAVLGIHGHDGCMADYCVLPVANLIEIPDSIEDHRAILIEPLSAACEILEQIAFEGSERVVVLGDGRLGTLCAWALSTKVNDVTMIGHHKDKLDLAGWGRLKTVLGASEVQPGADMVVDATGSAAGIKDAMSLCRPRGTIVLKSTIASQGGLNLAPVVVNEINVLGSRCGRFSDGLGMMQAYRDMPLERLITAKYPIEQALEAFDRAGRHDAMKVLLAM
jgi:alcohol dehydrogenase